MPNGPERATLLGAGPKELQRSSLISAMAGTPRSGFLQGIQGATDLSEAAEASIQAVMKGDMGDKKRMVEVIKQMEREGDRVGLLKLMRNLFTPNKGLEDEAVARLIEASRGERIGSR